MGREPAWWYDREASSWPRILRPLSAIYGWVGARRLRKMIAYKPAQPVICVGNFTAGGTGKTPFVAMMVELLTAMGARPAILSRGYGGSAKGPTWVEPARDTARLVGDEPLLLARSAPVLVARDRAAGARVIEADPRKFTHILMDDGLQNPSVAKTLSIALVDGARGFGNGEVIPAGPLRAPLAAQLERVDVIVVNAGVRSDHEPFEIARDLAQSFPGPVLQAHVAPRFDVSVIAGRPAVAFAGIGVPQRFFDLLDQLGVETRERRSLADHHAFTERDADALLAAAAAQSAVLLTTEKDMARLAGTSGSLARLREAAIAVPIRLVLSARDTERLRSHIAPLL